MNEYKTTGVDARWADQANVPTENIVTIEALFDRARQVAAAAEALPLTFESMIVGPTPGRASLAPAPLPDDRVQASWILLQRALDDITRTLALMESRR